MLDGLQQSVDGDMPECGRTATGVADANSAYFFRQKNEYVFLT
jgi:hypothetical protein